MAIMLHMLLNVPDSVAAKGVEYTRGYQLGAWIPFIVFGIIATLIIVQKKKS